MNFANMSALVWLPALAAVIVALYLLRMRRRDVQVPAVFLWPQRTEEVRANSLFQRLRFSWLLLLQLLALGLVITALARPQFRQHGLAGKVTVVVVDASASMGAVDVKPSRLEEARRMVTSMVNGLGAGDRLALIEAGPTPRVVFPLGNDPVKQSSGAKSLRQFDCDADMGEALRLAAAIAGTTEGARIVVVSDGAFEKVEDFSASKATVTYLQIGKSGENVGIQALGTSKGQQGNLAYVGVKNFGLQLAQTGVTLFADGKVVDSAKVRIGPGDSWGKTVRVGSGTKVVEARLDRADMLEADDYAVTVTDPSAHVRALLVTKGDMFLERALSLDPRVTLDKTDRVPESEKPGSAGTGLYDIVVFDGVAEEAVKARGVLTFGLAGSSSPVVATGSAKNPEYVSTTDHPVVAGVDFESVYIDEHQRVTPRGTGRILAETKEGPLVVVSSGSKRQVYVAFSPLDSDFPLNVGFPLLVGNALDFLIGQESSDVLAVKVGRPFVVPAGGAATAVLTGANGETFQIPSRADRIIVREVGRTGKHRLTIGQKTRTVYASMRSPVESSISPKPSLDVGASKVVAKSNLSRFEDFWQILLLASLIVLGVEWWAYARRS